MEIKRTENGMYITKDDAGKENGYVNLKDAITSITRNFLEGSPDINLQWEKINKQL